MPQLSTDLYRFGEFAVDSSRASLRRADTDIALRPKSFALLHYLVSHPGRLVTKDELLSAVWPNLVVTEDSLTRCVSEVRAALGDSAQQMIRTVSKRGYVFEAPVDKVVPDAPRSPAAENRPRTKFIASPAVVWSGLIAVSLSVGVWLAANRSPSEAPARMSIVVLPFANASGDAAQDYLADVITDELTIALSKLRGATVIASSSAFTFKGQQVDPKQIGDALQVRYALQGSVLADSGSVRINAQLVETNTATTLWTDQSDTDRTELFQTQDEIVRRLANALDTELIRAATRRAPLSGTSAVAAEDLAMRCDAASFRDGGEGTPSSGHDWCEEALRIDPRNVRALVRQALSLGTRVSRVQSSNPDADLTRANELVTRALELDPDYYATHCAKALVLEGRHRLREAIAASEYCLSLNPSNAAAYKALAREHFFLAQPDQTLAFSERGIRLSPRDPQMSGFLLFKGWAYFMLHKEEEALLWFRRADAAAPDSPTIVAALTSALALSGHDVEARAELSRYLRLSRTRTKTVAEWNYLPDDNAGFKRFDARFKSGLRRAGMPEE